MAMSEKVKQEIDITMDICPMTFVKTRLKLEKMSPGEILEVKLCDGEPLSNLPKSVKQEGHKVLDIIKVDSHYKVVIERC